VEVRHDEGIANHIGPEPGAVICKGEEETLVGEFTDQPLIRARIEPGRTSSNSSIRSAKTGSSYSWLHGLHAILLARAETHEDLLMHRRVLPRIHVEKRRTIIGSKPACTDQTHFKRAFAPLIGGQKPPPKVIGISLRHHIYFAENRRTKVHT
jgi:hypothetical protein